jgi:hypothetical protein
LLNKDNVLRVMDGVIASMQAIRHDLQDLDDQALEERLVRARRGREEWLKKRLEADWAYEGSPKVPTPSASELFGRLIGLGKREKK